MLLNELRSFTPEQRAVVEEGLQASAEAENQVTLAEYQSTLDAREALGQHLGLSHQKYDLLLTPTVSIAAFSVGQVSPKSDLYPPGLNWTPFTYPFNLTQQPAASVPIGFTTEGLPVGLQIVGAKYRDALVLQAARAYETVNPFKTLDETFLRLMNGRSPSSQFRIMSGSQQVAHNGSISGD
ncbi:amidase family protein [Phormidesmis priestleyi]